MLLLFARESQRFLSSQRKPGGPWGDRRASLEGSGLGNVCDQRSSDSTFCWLWLAWAIIAVEAWLRIWALASAVVSDE